MVRSRVVSFCVAAWAMGCCLAADLLAADKPIRKLTLDENAPVVALFDGIDAGQLKVHLSPRSAQESRVSITNLTDEPLTVALPKAAIGVHILPQFQQPQGFFNQNGNGQNQFGGQNQNQVGQSQTVGGGFQPFNQQQGFPNQNGNGNGLNNQFQGMNFFSIPPEKTVQLKLKTVCLNYGWPDPLPGMKYELRSVDSEISNPALRKLLENDSPRVDGQAMQAAAWHLANGLTWEQLARVPALGGNPILGGTMFSQATLKSAEALVKVAEKAAEKNDAEQPAASADASAKLTSARGK